MKKTLFLVIVTILITSCSSSDNGGGPVNSNEYVPRTVGNSWTYKVEENSNPEYDHTVTVSGEQTVSGKTYRVFNNGGILVGLTTTDDLLIRAENNKYFSLVSQTIGSESISFDYNFLDPSAPIGNFFETENQTISLPSIPVNASGFNGTITPTVTVKIKSKIDNKLNSYNVLSNTYNDVIKTKRFTEISINLQMNGTASILPPPLPPININQSHNWVPMQNIGEEEMFFAKDVGIVHSHSIINTTSLTFNNSVIISGFPIDLSPFVGSIIPLLNSLNNDVECKLFSKNF